MRKIYFYLFLLVFILFVQAEATQPSPQMNQSINSVQITG